MPEAKHKHVERRSAIRKPARFVLRYSIEGGQLASVSEVSSRDISLTGMSFIAPEVIAINVGISFELVAGGQTAPVKLFGRVKRIEELSDGKYLYAVNFEDFLPESKETLERYIQFLDIDSILRMAVKRNASDIHLVANQPPIFRVQGELIALDAFPLTPLDLKTMIGSILTERQRQSFEENLELDMSYLISEGVRFRVNIHMERGAIEAAFRIITEKIRGYEELNLPPILEELARKRRGLIIVSGPVGSGKTTTLAAMIQQINRERRCMIVSVEDPIEYVHSTIKSIIKQREVGADTLSFANALKHALRQDMNVILVGEMRDLESISMCLTAAETGHLVLTTLHTPDTIECINRIVDVYPASQQSQVRTQLSLCLEGIVAQILLPRKESSERIIATEVMIATSAIRNLIRTNRIEQIGSYIQAGQQFGMQAMDDSLFQLCCQGLVDFEVAASYARDPIRFKNKQM